MKIISIEPTPSPHTMKFTLDESLPFGQRFTYTSQNSKQAPDFIKNILEVEGVKSLFQCADFLAIDRTPKADWQQIISQIGQMFGDTTLRTMNQQAEPIANGFGQSQVLIQTFREIPMQIRIRHTHGELRVAMPEKFVQAALEAGMSSSQFIQERKLLDIGLRYGEPDEIAQEIIAEQEAWWKEPRLADHLIRLKKVSSIENDMAFPHRNHNVQDAMNAQTADTFDAKLIEQQLHHTDWQVRYVALQSTPATSEHLPLLAIALTDSHVLIRRLATAYLSEIKHPNTLNYLLKMLHDPSATVRRTAGDTISDRGDPIAMPHMITSLQDTNKLVRWRAARYLYEVGDESCVDALQNALDEPEFEVRMQIQMAIERITGGHKAQGPVWQQILNQKNSL